MGDEELNEIEARAKAATAEPWAVFSDAASYVEEVTGRTYCMMVAPGGNGHIACEITKEDARFIAHARTDVPRLIAEVRRMRDIK